MPSPKVRTIERAFDILGVFDRDRPRLTLKEIVTLTDLPKTTVVRLLNDLENRAIVYFDSEGRYTVGAALITWAQVADELWDVNQATGQDMVALVGEFGETVNVYVRQALTRVSIRQVEGRHTVRNVVPVGEPLPMDGGASATVLLSQAPELVTRLLAANPHIDPDRLRSRLAFLEEHGYAESDGDREVGAAAIAAPLHASDGRPIAALSMSGPSSRFDKAARDVAGPRLVEVARSIDAHGLGVVEGLV